jgi:hypothetical protein
MLEARKPVLSISHMHACIIHACIIHTLLRSWRCEEGGYLDAHRLTRVCVCVCVWRCVCVDRIYQFRDFLVEYDEDEYPKKLPMLCARMFAQTRGLGKEPEGLWCRLPPEKSYKPFLEPPKEVVSPLPTSHLCTCM